MSKILSALTLGLGALFGFLFGGWSPLLSVLLSLVIVDYITGMLAAGHSGELSSKVGFKGIGKKVIIFLLVATAHFIDVALGLSGVIMTATLFFYMANECLSILENAGKAGLEIPEILKKGIALLRDKGDDLNV